MGSVKNQVKIKTVYIILTDKRKDTQYTCICQFKKKLLLRCKHHFESDLINDMDHISGIEPSTVILRQTKSFKKSKSDNQKVPKQG